MLLFSNINNNKYVRPPVRPYPRPPYYYGGFHYYAYHPCYYHPCTPYYYGPYYNPWGVFAVTIAVTAIIVSVTDEMEEKEEY